MAIFYNPNRKKGLFYMPSGATGGDRLAIQYSTARFCEDGTDPIPGITGDTGGTFSSTTGLVFISTSTGQVDLSASTAGTYVVTYTAPSSDTATTSISIDSIPVVSAGADVAICTGNNTVLTASGATTYSWSTGQTGASITVDPTTNTTYTVTGFNGACSATDSVDVTVYPLPSVSISGTLTYCIGSNTTLDAGTFVSYLWSNGETTQTISATAGSYTVTVTDSNGCSNTSAQVTVSELPLDTATVTYSASAYCQMPTGALAVDGYYPLYSTESAAQAESSDGTAHSHTLSGTTYYMPNDGVTIYHGTYSLTTPAPTITGETGTFSESTGNLSIDSSTGVITLNSSTAGTYTVVYTTNGTCPNTVNNTITVNALDGATFSYSANSLPQTGTASLTTTPTTSGGVYSAYPSGLSINSSTGEIDLAASTIQSYKIFYETSGAGCPNSSTFSLAVTSAYSPFQMQFEVASGVEKIIEVSCTSTGNFTIDWGDNSTILNNYTTGTITHTYNAGNVGTTVDPVISFGDINDTGVLTNATHTASSRSDLIDVPQWGGMEFYRFAFSSRFQSCNNSRFQISATDAPNIETPVGSMKRLFRYANSAFNSDISHWDADVGSSFELAFTNITSFNQSLNSWDVSNATNLYGVFYGASSFDQYLGDWDIQTSGLYLFRNSGMSTENYTDTFVSWANKVYNNSAPYNLNFGTQSGMFFDRARSGGANFADAGAARDYLTGVTANWTITGDTEIN